MERARIECNCHLSAHRCPPSRERSLATSGVAPFLPNPVSALTYLRFGTWYDSLSFAGKNRFLLSGIPNQQKTSRSSTFPWGEAMSVTRPAPLATATSRSSIDKNSGTELEGRRGAPLHCGDKLSELSRNELGNDLLIN